MTYVGGGILGVAFGLGFAGVRGPWLDWISPPPRREPEEL
jgi:hypothetical protein